MQIKKSELNDIILQNALNEFLQKGFVNASLRNIAKNSGTTIGNLYHYFENKEALFDALVRSEYISFQYLMRHHHDGVEIPVELSELKNLMALRPFLNEFIDRLMPVFTKRFLLLLDKSEGTKYEHTKEEFLNILQEHFDSHINEYELPLTEGFGRAIAQQLISGILYIIETNDEGERLQQLICDTLLFYVAAFVHLL